MRLARQPRSRNHPANGKPGRSCGTLRSRCRTCPAPSSCDTARWNSRSRCDESGGSTRRYRAEKRQPGSSELVHTPTGSGAPSGPTGSPERRTCISTMARWPGLNPSTAVRTATLPMHTAQFVLLDRRDALQRAGAKLNFAPASARAAHQEDRPICDAPAQGAPPVRSEPQVGLFRVLAHGIEEARGGAAVYRPVVERQAEHDDAARNKLVLEDGRFPDEALST